jgi:hypothetical protein
MKNKAWIGVILLIILQWACTIMDTLPDYFCEMNGGTWHPSTLEEDAWCEPAKPTATPKPGEISTQSSNDAQEAPPTEKYLTPTPASAQACNATLYIQTQVEVIKNAQELYYRECDYKLSASNIHPSEGIWIIRLTNAGTHNPPKDCDSCYWYSDLLFPGQGWEKSFRATYFSDGKASFEYVSKVAGVFNRPECLYLITSPEVEAISQTVEWACAP